MKLASLRSKRDGELIVVSRDLSTAARAAGIATTMQDALDRWDSVEPSLQSLYGALNNGTAQGAFPLNL